MTNDEDFVIAAPYEKTADDDALIRQASPVENKAKDWKKSCLKEFKQRVRDYYRIAQNRRCAYCRTIIKTSQASPEVEHIIHKDDKPNWMYEPLNLCVSCKMCNTKKGTKKVLNDGDVVALPVDSKSYILIHPHIDRYSEHINILDDIFYEGLTDKGRETIRICELNRYELAADRADDKFRKELPAQEKELFALAMHEGHSLVNVMEKFKERIHEICNDYKQG